MTSFEKKVQQLAKDTKRSEKAATNLVFDSGLEFIGIVAVKVKDWRFMMLQFGALMRDENASKLTIAQWFETIRKSPVFWTWWAGELYGRLVEGKDYGALPQRVVREIFGIELPVQKVAQSDHAIDAVKFLLDTNLISKHKENAKK